VADHLTIKHVENVPEDGFQPGILYVFGDSKCAFKCPCGCGVGIWLNLAGANRPRWDLTEKDGIPTVTPSINRVVGCKSHFWIREGRIQWAGGLTATPIE
jgi:hypothetical protein